MIKSNAKRLFIASPVHLYNYDALKRDFNGVIEGKWVEEENLHMTWVFLGDVITLEAVINKLHNITSLDNDIGVAELGFFGHPPRIHFMKAENEMILYSKVKELEVAGFNIYRFKPHITICYDLEKSLGITITEENKTKTIEKILNSLEITYPKALKIVSQSYDDLEENWTDKIKEVDDVTNK